MGILPCDLTPLSPLAGRGVGGEGKRPNPKKAELQYLGCCLSPSPPTPLPASGERGANSTSAHQRLNQLQVFGRVGYHAVFGLPPVVGAQAVYGRGDKRDLADALAQH